MKVRSALFVARAPLAGVTLIELLVVLALLGLLFGVTALSVGALRTPRASAGIRALEVARAAAIRAGKPVPVLGDAGPVRFLPDGSALGVGVDPWTGAPHATR
jgi:prepilin-type N-terminal cleavage/methylation domain-containing protein